MKIYHLGEYVDNCAKVNYKANYKPGYLICPTTKNMVRLDQVQDRVEKFKRMPFKYKENNYKSVPLEGSVEPNKEGQTLSDTIGDGLLETPFLYKENMMLQLQDLTEDGRKWSVPLVK